MRSLVLALIASGCSFFMTVPDRIPAERKVYCSSVEPAIDGVIGALMLTMSGVVVSGARSPGAGVVGLTSGAIGLVFLGGSLYGAVQHSRCAKLRDSPAGDYIAAITRGAELLASRGKCVEAMQVGRRLTDYDRNYYAHVFLELPVIARCRHAANDQRRAELERQGATAEQQAAKRRRDEAHALFAQARKDAHAGDCTAVASVEVRIAELDVEVHSVWFLKDPEIAACLPK